ncbi:MAG TPA: PD-(D/E)XK nuclease family protein [Bryobacteraceae bacterium]|nr:PD-(D/E)XK nuclease family protein [Bryobacteraceae bacterium]
MLLLTGPAGSGKTFRILEQFRRALRRRDAGVRLLTPTATMAQHLQNQMAREGFVFRPSLIQTLSRFVDAFAADRPQVSRPLFYLIVEDAARRVNPPAFERVVRLPGFCAALARSMEELSAAGCDAQRLPAAVIRASPLGEAFAKVYAEVDRELRRRGLAMRSQRLLYAAERIARDGLHGVHTIWMDGFYALPDPESAAIAAMGRHADVVLTLPIAPVTELTRRRLLEMGFAEENCAFKPTAARRELVEAPSIEREVDEIAHRILEQVGAGRQFREMGVIVRCPEIYESILRAVLDRFGIPAHFYFDSELERHALVRFFSGMVEAMLGGWDHAETLAALRLAPGLPCDEFDFAVRERIPGRGLEALRAIPGGPRRLLESCAELDDWCTLVLAPREWAGRLQSLRGLFAPPPPEPGSYEAAAVSRSQAAALDAFDEAMQEAAGALPDRPILLGEFWRTAKSVVRLTPLRVADNRRNVVHVLDAHEARQWRLPVIFVCGLVEKQFPKQHAQDPFFPESVRLQIRQAGIRLRSAGDFETEERFLFDWAIARATESLTLSYPRTDARGQQNLPSLYLEGQATVAARHVAVRRPPPNSSAALAITYPEVLRQKAFQVTSLEVYLQCPFQYFGRDTLRLQSAPLRPEQRLDYRMQGSIVHGVLAELHRDGAALEEVFDRVFARLARKHNVPSAYRTEALREQMLADLHALVDDPRWSLDYEIRTEQDFEYRLTDGVAVKGRIDRIDITPDRSALVTDYKYSGDAKSRVTSLQPQLYMKAVERCFDLRAEGFSFWGFKHRVQAPIGISFDPGPAIETTLRIADEIRAGTVAPKPADPSKCRLCDYRDVCRFTAADTGTELAEGAATWD